MIGLWRPNYESRSVKAEVDQLEKEEGESGGTGKRGRGKYWKRRKGEVEVLEKEEVKFDYVTS